MQRKKTRRAASELLIVDAVSAPRAAK